MPFFDHMLAQLGKHGGFDLPCAPRGDLEVDAHHTVEDTAIALGQALREALGDKAGIRRFGDALVPLDETLVQAAVDLSGRPYLVHEEPEIVELIGSYDTTLTRHIWESFTASARRSACTCGCSPAATPTTSSRRSSRRWPARCATPSRSTPASTASRPPRARCSRRGPADPDRASGRLLPVDGTPQSHVDLDDPTYLSFEYVRRIGHVVDLVAEPGIPLSVVHLGAGALTLARYVEATRPGSRQRAVESSTRSPRRARRAAARSRRAGAGAGGRRSRGAGRLRDGTADLVVLDVFAGARTPAHLTSAEMLDRRARVLAPAGVFVANVADGPGLSFARGQLATYLARVRPRRCDRRAGHLARPPVRQRRAARLGRPLPVPPWPGGARATRAGPGGGRRRSSPGPSAERPWSPTRPRSTHRPRRRRSSAVANLGA